MIKKNILIMIIIFSILFSNCATFAEYFDWNTREKPSMHITSVPTAAKILFFDRTGNVLSEMTTPANITNVPAGCSYIEIIKDGYFPEKLYINNIQKKRIIPWYWLNLVPLAMGGYLLGTHFVDVKDGYREDNNFLLYYGGGIGAIGLVGLIFDPFNKNVMTGSNSINVNLKVNPERENELRQIAESRRLRDLERDLEPDFEDDFDVMQLTDGTIAIIEYRGVRKNVIIPDTLYGLRVTIIGPGAFRNKGLTSVEIPDSVISIESSSTLFGPLSMVSGAFEYNSLTRVKLGNGLTKIGSSTFYGISTLTEIEIPNSVVTIGSSAFKDTGLVNVTFGNNLQTIEAEAFRNTMITSLIIPNSVKNIGNRAFSSNPNLTTIVIPPSLAALSRLTTVGGVVLNTNFFIECPNISRVTLPANTNDHMLSNFDVNLRNFYISQGRRAGTYIKNGPVWVLETH